MAEENSFNTDDQDDKIVLLLDEITKLKQQNEQQQRKIDKMNSRITTVAMIMVVGWLMFGSIEW